MSPLPRAAHRLRTAAVAAGAAVAIVLGAPATAAHASWAASAPLGAAALSTGALAIGADHLAGGTWTSDGAPFDPATDRLTAGVTATYTVPGVPVTALGNNLEASFSVGGAVVPDTLEDHVTVAVASDPSPVPGATSGTGERTVTLLLTVAADAGLPAGARTVDLRSLTVTLGNGYGWTDTATLDAGVLTTAPAASGGRVHLKLDLTTDADRTVGFHLTDPGPGTTIEWGEWTSAGTQVVTPAVDGLNQHTYAPGASAADVYVVGTFAGFGSPEQTVEQVGALTHVAGWSEAVGSRSASSAFRNAVHLVHVDGLPSGLADVSYAFAHAGSAASHGSPYLGPWDASGVVSTAHMFEGASRFDQYGVGAWDVGSVVDMTAMFRGATVFTQDLSRWDVGAVVHHDDFATGSALTPDRLPRFPTAAATAAADAPQAAGDVVADDAGGSGTDLDADDAGGSGTDLDADDADGSGADLVPAPDACVPDAGVLPPGGTAPGAAPAGTTDPVEQDTVGEQDTVRPDACPEVPADDGAAPAPGPTAAVPLPAAPPARDEEVAA